MMKDYLYSIITDNKKGIFVSLIKFYLFCLSLVYSELLRIVLLCFRLKIFKTYTLPFKVISVGNITWGGTGKTPIVEFIARYLINQGRRPAILTRGYKRKSKISAKGRSALGGKNQESKIDYKIMGDEPYLLKQKLDIPVIVNSDRKKGAEIAKNKFNVDTIILDDGFQQFSIRKDLNILAIDALNPFGNFMVIPRGILREPLSSIARADIIIISKSNLIKKENIDNIKKIIYKFNKKALIFEAAYELILPIIRENKICTITSIASPLSFKNILLNSGFDIILEFNFYDHYSFRKADIDKIVASCNMRNNKIIFTTEKDWVRLEQFKSIFDNAQIKIYILPLRIKIEDEAKLFSRIFTVYLG
ncbi:MAG: tetraacyldisaccharide 4'-kinase [Candidatus Omnitrophota bacterium]